jgi:XapX domain-containing protein
MIRITIGFVLSFVIGAGCRYFDIPAASPPVIPGALIVLAMTLGYTPMDRIVSRKERVATTKHLCGGPTGLPVATKSHEAKSLDFHTLQRSRTSVRVIAATESPTTVPTALTTTATSNPKAIRTVREPEMY